MTCLNSYKVGKTIGSLELKKFLSECIMIIVTDVGLSDK
jgi:hypothetical protein